MEVHYVTSFLSSSKQIANQRGLREKVFILPYSSKDAVSSDGKVMVVGAGRSHHTRTHSNKGQCLSA